VRPAGTPSKEKKSGFRRTCLSHSNQITTTAPLQRNSFLKADSSPKGHLAIAISIGPPVGAKAAGASQANPQRPRRLAERLRTPRSQQRHLPHNRDQTIDRKPTKSVRHRPAPIGGQRHILSPRTCATLVCLHFPKSPFSTSGPGADPEHPSTSILALSGLRDVLTKLQIDPCLVSS
jgi:hypothetical protein